MYMRKHPMLPPPRKKRGLFGFGDFTDSDQCSTIPIGDPYRKPGNYCATPDGGMTTFNSDGSTYRAPGAVDPDPAHPAGSSGSISGGGSIWDAIAGSLLPRPTVAQPVVAGGGMSTTTMLAIGGGIVVLALVLSRR